MHERTVTGLEVESTEVLGGPAGFLRVCRVSLRNRRDDGSTSDVYVCDYLARPKGVDAVVVVLYRMVADKAVVLLRTGLRPALLLGRADADVPIPDGRTHAKFTEVVAGIIERGDVGEAGIRARAVAETLEEAGLTIAAGQVEFLGAGTFPSPGSMPEKFWLVAADVSAAAPAVVPPTDGSPMEEGARCAWLGLDDAITDCVRGAIEDCKTELALRRLRDHLSGDEAYSPVASSRIP